MDGEGTTGEIEVASGSAEASIGSQGATFGASFNAIGAGLQTQAFSKADTMESRHHLGVGLGVGAAGRLHWGDEDGDGFQELGFGFDAGPLSYDLESEDILRDLTPGFLQGLLPEENATQSALQTADRWIMDGGDALLEALFPPSGGLDPL